MLKVSCFLPSFNAGETTRGIELCHALIAHACERGREIAVRLAYSTGEVGYEAQITNSGLNAHRLPLNLDEQTVTSIMTADHHGGELVSDIAKARQFIQVIMDDIVASLPDLVVCGFVPPGGNRGTDFAGSCCHVFTVSGIYRPWVRRHFLRDIPDDLDKAVLAASPARVRKWLVKAVSVAMFTKGIFKQPTFAAAGRQLGWQVAHPDLFSMFASSLQLVTDLAAFYGGQDVGANTRITGPLFSLSATSDVAPEIRHMFAPGNPNRVFVSMGSSGERPHLLAAIEALATIDVRAVVIVAPRICSLVEVRRALAVPPHILLTDSFVPAHEVNAMADAAIIHGEQGTVQTAVSSGTPIVVVGMQVEQSTNLDNVARRGAAIRITKRQWKAETIRRALRQVLEARTFRQNAVRLKREYDAVDGRTEAA